MNKFYENFLRKSLDLLGKVNNLTFLGDPILSTKTNFSSYEEAVLVCANLEKSLKQIRDVTGVGRGLAAPQIGSNGRCFVTFVNDDFQYYINPIIISHSPETNWYRENCLSCGPICCDIERHEEIVLSFTDKDGKQKEEKHSDFMARLLQHEYDHLEGIVNVTKANPEDISIIAFDPLKEKLRSEK